MKKFIKEFKEFAMRGNVIDLAVGVIIGGAFGAIVTSFINDIVMPLIGLATGGASFQDRFVVLTAIPKELPEGVTEQMVRTSLDVAKEVGVATLNYGSFVTAILNFIIMAFVIFLMVKAINKLTSVTKKKEEETPAEPTTKICPFCKSEISIEATRCPHCTSELKE